MILLTSVKNTKNNINEYQAIEVLTIT